MDLSNVGAMPAMNNLAYTDAAGKLSVSVGIPVIIRDYINTEWIGTTKKAETIRNGYRELEKMGCTHLLPIRGDNYCAIRSTLFQTFSMDQFDKCPLTAEMESPTLMEKVIAPSFIQYPILNEWTFANKGEFLREGPTQEVLELCIRNLAFEVEQIRGLPKMDRMLYFYNKLNTQKEMYDYSLMESIKYHMFLKAAEFWEMYKNGEKLPTGMDHFFLRETSSSLEDYFRNHLNKTGESGGLEMIEMFLLGYTLGLQIKVARLSSFGNEDFISYYPPGEYPKEKVLMISAEDDRHYNVIANLDNVEEFLKFLTIPRSSYLSS